MRLQILLERCLRAAESELEQTIEATRASRREHIGATADLEAVAAKIAEQVKVLDGLVRYQFGDNAELIGTWASPRSVLGPFKSEGGAGGRRKLSRPERDPTSSSQRRDERPLSKLSPGMRGRCFFADSCI